MFVNFWLYFLGLLVDRKASGEREAGDVTEDHSLDHNMDHFVAILRSHLATPYDLTLHNYITNQYSSCF